MKKRIILAMIIGVVIVGGTVGVVRLNNKNWYQNIKEEFITSDEFKKTGVIDGDRNTKTIEEVKAEEKLNNDKAKVEEIKKEDTKETVKEDSKKEEVKKKDDNKSVKVTENKEEVSKQIKPKTKSKPKEVGQSLDEGYDLCYRARDAYDRGDVDEALRLYNQITNKAALAKTVDEKKMYEFSKNVGNEISKCESLYNQGDYMNARLKIKELLGSHRMTDNQRDRCVALIRKTDKKVGTTGEAKLNKNFTYEKAVQLVKNYSGLKNQTYEFANQNINEDGLKTYYIIERDKTHKNYVMMYIVNSNGKVQQSG